MLKKDYFHQNCCTVSVNDFVKNEIIDEISEYGEDVLKSVTGLTFSDLCNLPEDKLKNVLWILEDDCEAVAWGLYD